MTEITTEAGDRLAFGARLRDARTGAGLTQESVAGELGFSAVSLYRWENGKELPSINRVVRLADLYGVAIDWLVGRTPFRRVFRPGKVIVDTGALERVRSLSDRGGRLEDLPADLVRAPGIDYAWSLPESATLFDGEAAAGIEQEMQRLLDRLRRRSR